MSVSNAVESGSPRASIDESVVQFLRTNNLLDALSWLQSQVDGDRFWPEREPDICIDCFNTGGIVGTAVIADYDDPEFPDEPRGYCLFHALRLYEDVG